MHTNVHSKIKVNTYILKNMQIYIYENIRE
jgi:hypothetical protein